MTELDYKSERENKCKNKNMDIGFTFRWIYSGSLRTRDFHITERLYRLY